LSLFVIFQKREFSEKAAKYFPKEYAYPYKEQFRGYVHERDLPRLREIVEIECQKRNINIRGKWQAVIFSRAGIKTLNIGVF